MQRTAVIYGLAVSTLVGAFFLVPRMANDATTSIPVPTPIGRSPITQLSYGDGTLEVRATLDRGYLAASSIEPIWMDLSIKASGVKSRVPLAAVLVIDRSGSMAGDKINAARMAAERFVQRLGDGDALAIISYGTDVTVDLGLTEITGETRGRALSIVRHIEEGGGTNIDGGLLAARNLLQAQDLGARVGRVVLISDGRPTEGDRRTAVLAGHTSGLRGAGAVTSTLGLGLDYNEDLMEQLAVEGGGRYHYLRDGSQLAQILDNEFEHGSNVVARGVRVHLPRQLAGLRVVQSPGSRDIGNADKLVVDVGDMAAGEERHILVKLESQGQVGETVFVAPELTYHKPGATVDMLVAHRADPFRVLPTTDLAQLNASRRDDVRVRVLQVEASLALTESMQAWSTGDVSLAKKRLERARSDVREAARATGNATLAAEAKNLDDVAQTVAAAPASEQAQDVIKSQKARAFEMRR